MQYGTKGEGRDGATGGLPNGGEGGQAAEAAAETTSAERDSRTLDVYKRQAYRKGPVAMPHRAHRSSACWQARSDDGR